MVGYFRSYKRNKSLAKFDAPSLQNATEATRG
jgi:hypothetical protein